MTPQTIGIICLAILLLFLIAAVVDWYFGQVPLQRRPESRTEQRQTPEVRRWEDVK